jgi:predicted nucleic acid-binding protein
MANCPSTYLIDNCAAATILANNDLRASWHDRLTQGLIAMCPVILLEMLYSAQNEQDRLEMQEDLDTLFVPIFSADLADDTALEFQEELTRLGWQRSAGAVDLLCAANAALFGLSTLSMDADFERISEATGMPNTRIHRADHPVQGQPRFWETTTPTPAAHAA